MPKPTAQDCHTLITYFVSRCEAQGVKVRFNRNKARWGFESVLLDYTKEEARELVEYYTEHWEAQKLDMDWFLYNYDKVDEDMQDRAEREARQKIIREATKERLERWNDRW